MISPKNILFFLAAGRLISAQKYSLVDNYDSSNFFEGFEFFDQADPTNGFVSYQNQSRASSLAIAGTSQEMVYLGADTKAVDSGGVASTRVSSTKAYYQGLFLLDVNHIPTGCGVWPAWWILGQGQWPNKGEIDIIEGVNSAQTNTMTLHTNAGCSMSKGTTLGSTKQVNQNTNCNANQGYDGCGQSATATNGYGKGLNAIAGGIYAMEWTDESISVWFFPRNSSTSIALSTYGRGSGNGVNASTGTSPFSNETSSTIDISGWGTPTAKFVAGAGCDMSQHFFSSQIIFDTTFCGSWAGQQAVWSQDAVCSKKAATCQEFVSDPSNAAELADAYWLFNSVRVYQKSSNSSGTATLQPPTMSTRNLKRMQRRRFVA